MHTEVGREEVKKVWGGDWGEWRNKDHMHEEAISLNCHHFWNRYFGLFLCCTVQSNDSSSKYNNGSQSMYNCRQTKPVKNSLSKYLTILILISK